MDREKSVKWVCMDADDVERSIARIAHEILEDHGDLSSLLIVGVLTRGDVLATRLADVIERIEGARVPIGHLDISFYRDDYATRLTPQVHATDVPFDIDGKTVVLTDDVLFTGRTVRAALDALSDLGRPANVRLAVLVDRGHRELPIRADFVGKSIPTSSAEDIRVSFEETDGFTRVEIVASEPQAEARAVKGGWR